MNYKYLNKIIISILLLSGFGGISANASSSKTAQYKPKITYMSYNYHSKYPYTQHDKNTALAISNQKIAYYTKKYNYWKKKFVPVNKASNAVFDEGTKYSNRLYELSDYYYGKMDKYDNDRGRWCDVKYGISHYPMTNRGGRHLIRRLYKYGIGHHNDELLSYLDICSAYNKTPAVNHKIWMRQLLRYVYEQ